MLGPLETDRLVLCSSTVDDAETFFQLWTERDPRVPEHRRLSPDGHPTVTDIRAGIVRADVHRAGLDLLTVVRKDVGDAIGYCGLIEGGHGSPEELERAYELLHAVHGRGYATESAGAVVAWAAEAGRERLWAVV